MDENGLGHDWLCARIFSDRLEVKLADPAQAQSWQERLSKLLGIHQVRACPQSGRLELTFDVRHHNRKELRHRICGSSA